MKIANFVVEGENIRRISDILYNHRGDYEMPMPHIYSSEDIKILMRECYYMRIASTLMSVIIFKFINDNKVEIELVVSGAKQGMLMWSWGAEQSENRVIAYEIKNVCSENSWKITSMEPENVMESLTESTVKKIKEKIANPFKK